MEAERNIEKASQNGMRAGIEALTGSFRYVFILLTVFIFGTIVWYFTFWGYFTVNPQEAAIVLRFGKITNVYTEDWHWAFPYPVNRIVRIPRDRQVMMIKAFWPNPSVNVPTGEEMAAMAQPIVPGRDGSLITGDANIIHTQWEIVYEISNPEKYFKSCLCPDDPGSPDENMVNPLNGKVAGTRGPQTMLKSIFEDEIIKATAVQKVEDPLYKEVTKYQDKVEKGISDALLTWDIGVILKSALLKDKTPPFSIVAAFHDVINAEQQSESIKLKAKNYAVKAEQEALTESKNIIVDSEVYKSRVVSEIESESVYFKKILVEYRQNRQSVLIPLYTDTVVSLLEKIKDKYIIPESNKGEKQELRIMLNPEPDYKKKKEEKEKTQGQ